MANNCADETALKNPFRDGVRRERTGALNLFDAKNPIPSETEDEEKVSQFFQSQKLMPFAGTEERTGHKLLSWYIMIAKLSSTNDACVDKLARYVIGSKAKAITSEDPEFDIPVPEITDTEAANYLEKLKEVVEFDGGARSFHDLCFRSFKNTGNAWAELVVTNVNGVVKAKIIRHKTTSVMYKITKPDDPKIVAISPVWTAEYLKKNPAKLRAVYPFFTEDGGVTRTVFHLKNGENTWYGRPDSDGSVLSKYREVQDSIYLIKQSAANFVGQLIIEVEEDTAPVIDEADAVRSGFNSFSERMEENYTQKGEDPQSVLVASRPMGSRPMFVYQIKPNTNENWYKVTGEIDSAKIMQSHGVTRRFMGMEVGSGLSETAFLEDYITNVDPVVKSLRATLMNWTNSILSALWEHTNMMEMNKYSLSFDSPLKQMLIDYNESKKTKQPGNDNSTPGSNLE